MNRLAIVGAGALGQQIAKLASNNGWNVIGFFDDFQKINTLKNGIKILGGVKGVENQRFMFDEIALAIGYKHFQERQRIFQIFENKYSMATIIDKSAIISPSSIIETGCVIMPGVIIGDNTHIKRNVFINIGSTIAHDSVVGAHSFIAPSVAVAGFTTIGERSFIGINSTIIDNLTLCDDVKIGGGTVVIKDISTKGLWVGNPARHIQK